MKFTFYIFSALFAAIAFQSCLQKGVRGNGEITENEINISNYKEIRVDGVGKIIYEQKSDTIPYLKIVADENIYPLLNIGVENEVLSIIKKEDINPSKLEIYTNSVTLERISVNGSIGVHLKNKIEIANLKINIAGAAEVHNDSIICNNIDIDMAGAGSVKLIGKTTHLKCDIAGAGQLNTFDLVADSVICNAAGMGRFNVYADKYLKIDMSGMGSVSYKGQPQINKSISGMGKVSDAN